MKKISYTILFAAFFATTAKAQIFGFLKAPEKVKIYGLEIKSNQIATGLKKFSGSAQSFYPTSLITDINKTSGDYLTDMGTYRTNYLNYKEGSNPLFNLSYYRNHYPILDTIDMDFYRSFGIDKVYNKNPNLYSDATFKKLRDVLVDCLNWSTKQKKDFLYSKEFDSYRKLIIDSRMDLSANNKFEIERKKVNISTVKLKATLDNIIIQNGLKGNANVVAYMQNLADENVKVTGMYYNPTFDLNYIGKIQYFLSAIQVYDTKLDQFAFWLQKYINSDIVAANTELVAIQLTGTYYKTKITADSIAVDLSAKFQIPKAQADKIGISVSIAFSKNETTTVSSSFQNVYVVRYFTSKNIDELIFKHLKEVNAFNSKFP
jgi:hypothetical protein